MEIKTAAEKKYQQLVKHFHKVVGDRTTYDDELRKVAKRLFGRKFMGVFPSDRIPKMKNKQMLIANLDSSGEPGSHWVAIVKENNTTLVYDSFGRSLHKILPKFQGRGKVIMTEKDAEQRISEDDCGARSLAFLSIFHKYGGRYAKFI
jgi:hypothetical protein